MIEALVDLAKQRRLAVLTGAGCSTESGIPDYRGDGARRRSRPPVQYGAFVRDEHARRRYWARSLIGWPLFRAARPNAAHHALAALERAGTISGIVTQNVDRLHHAAGSRRIVELHGALAEVRCLACGASEDRSTLQERLLALNPSFEHEPLEIRPDGDAELRDELLVDFRVPGCTRCGGVLKPDVVLFGENVPRDTVDDAWRVVDSAEALLVVGSSLAVFSGFRFVRGAAQRGAPIAIVNRGPTRGDPHASVRIDDSAGSVLEQLAAALA